MTEPFADYRGRAYMSKIDADQQVALDAWEQILRLGQGLLVDGAYFIDTQLYLCAETAEYIYSDYTPTTVDYAPGSRPKLEAVLDRLGIRGLGEFERFLWLERFVRDLPNTRGWNGDLYSGGTEEQLIEKRVVICNEQARLMITLCQVAGLPARYIGHHIGGHGVTEVFLDGGWAYYDIRGRFFLKADGRLAGTWEIWQDPSILRSQSEWVTRELHPRYARGDPYAVTERNYFHPKECTGVVNYFIADREKFDYATTTSSDPEFVTRTLAWRIAREEIREKFGMIVHASDWWKKAKQEKDEDQ